MLTSWAGMEGQQAPTIFQVVYKLSQLHASGDRSQFLEKKIFQRQDAVVNQNSGNRYRFWQLLERQAAQRSSGVSSVR
jgi:hypothetical protein